MTALGDYLTRVAARRRQAGVWDCCTFPAEWVMTLGQPDPMAHWRGRYATEADGVEQVGAAGLAAAFAEGLDPLFPRTTGEYAPGDVAVIATAGQEAGAIYCGKRWAFVLDRGLGFMHVEPDCIVAAWGVSAWAQ